MAGWPVSIDMRHGVVPSVFERLWAALPLWGSLLAAALIVSRSPDAFTHAQFWAEDGKLFYADVYNRGMLATLAVPQAGYFLELPIIAARIAQLVPLAQAPLVMNAIGVAVRVLPVGLLLSRRAETITPDLRVRALLAVLYISLPGSAETNANAVNTSWYLAVAAAIVLISRPPKGLTGRALDFAILVLCSLTGVFVIALAPLAFMYRRWRGRSAVSGAMLAVLLVGAGVQLVALLILQYHLPSGFGATSRPTMALHSSAQAFLEILGVRVIAEPILGNSVMLNSTMAGLLGALGVTGLAAAFLRGSAELRLLIAFGASVLVMSLIRPIGTDWPGLLAPYADSRYFVIPQFAVVAALLWACGYGRHTGWIVPLAATLLFMCAVAIPSEWKYAPLGENGFARHAAQFERVRAGTTVTIPIQPAGWSMTLLRH